MKYMLNTNFMKHIVKPFDTCNRFGKEELSFLMLHLQVEVHLLIQTAIKIMKKDKRTQLVSNDIQMAAQALNHQDLFPIAPIPSHFKRKQFLNIKDLTQKSGLNLQSQIQDMKLKGSYLYHDGSLNQYTTKGTIRIMKKKENNGIHSQRVKAKGQFSLVIQKNPKNLTSEQTIFIYQIENILSQNQHRFFPDLGKYYFKLFPFLVVLMNKYPNQASIKLLYILINSSEFETIDISFYLFKILKVLLVYRGCWSYCVGKMIGYLVNMNIKKQPSLADVMQKNEKDYNHFLKIIGFEEVTKSGSIPFEIDTFFTQLIKDSMNGNQMACLCLKTLIEKSFEVQNLMKRLDFPFYYPNFWFSEDKYLNI